MPMPKGRPLFWIIAEVQQSKSESTEEYHDFLVFPVDSKLGFNKKVDGKLVI
jgi:hypothetical protein